MNGIVPGGKSSGSASVSTRWQLGHLPTYDTESAKAGSAASCWWKSGTFHMTPLNKLALMREFPSRAFFASTGRVLRYFSRHL